MTGARDDLADLLTRVRRDKPAPEVVTAEAILLACRLLVEATDAVKDLHETLSKRAY